MKAFVTGATGFLGASIVRELLRDGHQVTALARPGGDRRNLAGLPVAICAGDLRDRSSLERAMLGSTVLFHAAADYRLWTPDPVAMYASNVTGTRNILESALALQYEKVVYTSSVGTLGNPGDGTPGREDTPVSLADMVGDYKRSKFLAERVAEEFSARGLPLVIVNPSTPVGPYDIKPTPTGKIIVDFLRRKMPAYLDTGLNIIGVKDCARGHLLAASRGKSGEKYILGGTDLALREIFQLLAQITGIQAPTLRLPYLPILLAAHLNDLLARVTGREPLIPLAGVQMARKRMYFDSSKARRDLGLPHRPAKEALQSAVHWFKNNGYA